MKRLTVHLNKVKKKRIDEKYVIVNTLSYKVKDENEALAIVSMLNDQRPSDNVKKWYLSNIK